jgi:hypothetical protein
MFKCVFGSFSFSAICKFTTRINWIIYILHYLIFLQRRGLFFKGGKCGMSSGIPTRSHPYWDLSVSSPGLLWRIRPEIRSSSSNGHRLPALLCRLVRRQPFPACVFLSYILCIYILLHIVIINIIKYIVCDIDYLLPFKLGYTTQFL